MIDTRELRIGNFVSQYHSWGVAVPYWRDWGIELGSDIDHVLSNPNKYNGIQLTEEWLLKFGYSSSFSTDPQNFPASKQFDLKGFKIHQPIEDVEQFIFDPLVNDYIELKSVHQLQNLYFALTGEELTIKQ